MKKRLLSMGAFLCGVIFFLFSCSKKEEQNALLQDVQGLEMQFDAWRELASYHSLALENIYVSLKDSVPSGKSFVEGIDESKMSLVLKGFLEKEVSKDSFRKASRALTLTTVKGQLRSAEPTADVVDEEKVNAFFNDFCLSIEKMWGGDLSGKIRGCFRNPILLQMNPTEQKVVLVRIAIYEDSFSYWKENYRAWVTPVENLRSSSLRCEDWFSDLWEKAKQLAKADAEGPTVAIIIGGAVSGAVNGGLVGGSSTIGAGAGPGALVGGLAGAAGAIIGSAVEASCGAASGGGGGGNGGGNGGGKGGGNGGGNGGGKGGGNGGGKR